MSNEPIIAVRGLTKRFKETVALRDITFEVPRGMVWGFVGRNGAGKTTTLRILSTLARPDDGTVRLDGLDPSKQAIELRRKIGFLPDLFTLPSHLNLEEYLDVFGGLYGQSRAERNHRRDVVLQLVGAEAYRTRRLAGLSRGEQQRVGLARCLMHNPDVLLLDEPAAGLDPHARVEFKELLRLLRERGKSVLFSSHILSDIEEVCDGIAVIREGRTLYNGSLDGFYLTIRRSESWILGLARPWSDGIPIPEKAELIDRAPDRIELRGVENAAERSAWIAALIARGIPVCELTPARTSLEHEFARLSEDA